jgi:hypothetical protein
MIDRTGETLDFTDSLVMSMHQCESPLAKAFFSATNMNVIQSNLRIIVREKTGYLIGRQDDEQVALIMRSVFILHANTGARIEEEVRRLNAHVLSQVAPMVGTGIAGYLGYVRDASQMHVPLERPKNMSLKGTKTTELFKAL